jgi:sulfite reductase (NADPH) hemoprotein beta-component
VGFEVLVGGGLGRTPIIGQTIRPFLEKRHLLSYLEAVLRIYNLYGRRDNKYKARIKILLKETGVEDFTRQVEAEWEQIREGMELDDHEIARVARHFLPPPYDREAAAEAGVEQHASSNKAFAAWLKRNTMAHKVAGYSVVFVSLKASGIAPGDMTAEQMHSVAELADRYSFGEIRVTHTQNLVLADVRLSQLHELWEKLSALNLATPNIGTATDIICCPGLDFCSLANASSIPIALEITQKLEDLDYLYDLGDIRINISGCMNGCGHHTVGHIGILGVDKKGEEWFQLTLGGSSANDASLGERLGPALAKDEVAQVVDKILRTYMQQREGDETFLETVRRIGVEPFQETVYADN